MFVISNRVLLAGVTLLQCTLSLPLNATQYGIGFHFTPAYATAAVSLVNGSNVELVRLEGDQAWRELMQDISWEPEEYVALRKQEIELTDSRIPPNALSTLVTMLRSLVNESEHRLGQPVTAAAVSMPCRNAINHWGSPIADLVKEAFSWIGLEYLEIVRASYYGEPLLYPENVVLAGHNMGLCQPYTSPYSCLDDDSQVLPGVSYFLVGYYANALEVIITSTTYVAYGVTPGNFLDYNLGAEARHRNPDEAFYWEQVRRLLHIPLIRRKLETPSKLVYYGDYSDDIHLRSVVREVMRSFLDEADMPEIVADGIDPVFAGALGAAEFAKRKPYWDVKNAL